ncbi:MAG: ThiF family adenylyltransferase [Planctomycetaceae bacterium]|nr:ThiF family adenylyltransferase [Planctomycetaceae bacterium]
MMTLAAKSRVESTASTVVPHADPSFSYDEAFSRHDGLLTREEQEKLRHSRVAIIGMGGVGGVHLITLARLGIGKFTIADPDSFELANFNRQYGANMRTVGRPKVDVMAEEALAINPEIDIRKIGAPIGEENVAEFLDDADILVDGVDFFAIDARRLVFREARRRGIWALTAGPHAYGTAWLAFDPQGMSFEEFFDFRDDMDQADKIVAFSVGCCPSPIHLSYVDFSRYFQPGRKAGASLGLACSLATGMVGALTAKTLLGHSGVRPAPYYGHFDAYRQKLVTKRLRGGNRHPWQQLKRWWLKRRMQTPSAKVS